MKNATWVRDTLITVEAFNNVSVFKQQEITKLVTEFNSLGYIDARTELGPNQTARMSDRQRQKLRDTANKVFSIEMQIKRLLTHDNIIKKRELTQKKKELTQIINSDEAYIRHILSMSTSFKKNGSLKIGYQRGVDHHEKEALKAHKRISCINVKLLSL